MFKRDRLEELISVADEKSDRTTMITVTEEERLSLDVALTWLAEEGIEGYMANDSGMKIDALLDALGLILVALYDLEPQTLAEAGQFWRREQLARGRRQDAVHMHVAYATLNTLLSIRNDVGSYSDSYLNYNRGILAGKMAKYEGGE